MKVIGIDVLYMIEMKLIFFCLVERRDDGKFLCIVLDVLQEIQNNFVENLFGIVVFGKCVVFGFME